MNYSTGYVSISKKAACVCKLQQMLDVPTCCIPCPRAAVVRWSNNLIACCRCSVSTGHVSLRLCFRFCHSCHAASLHDTCKTSAPQACAAASAWRSFCPSVAAASNGGDHGGGAAQQIKLSRRKPFYFLLSNSFNHAQAPNRHSQPLWDQQEVALRVLELSVRSMSVPLAQVSIEFPSLDLHRLLVEANMMMMGAAATNAVSAANNVNATLGNAIQQLRVTVGHPQANGERRLHNSAQGPRGPQPAVQGCGKSGHGLGWRQVDGFEC